MTMYHFYLAVTRDDVRPMSTYFLPRVGDTIHVDGIDRVISKITWFTKDGHIGDSPLVNLKDVVIHNQVVGASNDLAQRISAQFGSNQKIAAIKEYRSQTGAGLREAKFAIDDAWVALGR